MSLTDCSHACQYNAHRSVAEDYECRPVGTFFDFRYRNMSGNQTGKWPPLLSATNLWSLSKVKVISFLMGLTFMFIVMASYLLTWDKEGLLFTTSPEQFRPVVILASPLATAAPDASSEGVLDMKPLVQIIDSKLEYTPRTAPILKDVFKADSHVSLQRVSHRSYRIITRKIHLRMIIQQETTHNQPSSKDLFGESHNK